MRSGFIDCLRSYPSIVTWVPFNEAWGQFKTVEIAEWTKKYDTSRLVNPASGGNFYHTGDMLDLHNYPGPEMYLADGERPTVLGEYGGIGLPIKGHLWQADKNWGYVQFKNAKEVTDEYVKYAEKLKKLAHTGFSAAVYTQTTDFGKFLDPLADKLLTIAAMAMFCEWKIFPAWALMIVLTREFAVTGLRLIAVQKGNVIAAGWSGKVKTASTMVGIIAWLLFPTNTVVGLVVSIVIVVTTVYSGVEYFVKNWSCLWD